MLGAMCAPSSVSCGVTRRALSVSRVIGHPTTMSRHSQTKSTSVSQIKVALWHVPSR